MDRDPQSLTSLPAAPADERASRMVSYSISMLLRLICLYLCFVVPGWWVIIPVAGVIILPAVAVMFANVVRSPGAQKATSHTLNLTSLPSGK